MSNFYTLPHRAVATLAAFFCVATVCAAAPLAVVEYRITGSELRVTPAALSVPKGIAGSVLVELTGTSNTVPAGAFVDATLRGPSFPARRLVGPVNAPLLLPPLPLVGDYQLDSIRLVRQEGTNLVTLFEASPSSVPVRVFDEVLVSRVTSRPLSLQEIQDKGIVIDQQNFRAIEFEVGFVLDGKTIPVRFPVVAPTFNQATEIIPAAELEERLKQAEAINNQLDLSTVLPKELETARLNIDLKGINFQVTEEGDADLQLRIPPIPALMMIPGNIGFLNQFFSVQIFTENAAPQGSGLSAYNILAELKLPPGPDQIASTNFNAPGDDPLRFARVGADKIIQPIQPVVRPGPDTKIGTADDIGRLFPGDTGQGEFLVEGLQEGLHVMDLDLTADLDGFAAGTVKIKGKAAGSVLVRNPKFSLAFSHPRTIRSGEPYDAYVTVLNTSGSVANLVQVSLPSAAISGGVLESAETVVLGTIAPGQTATAKFTMRAQRTGAISFSNLTTSEDSLVGRFRLRMGIDERGVTLSPDTLAMPDFVTHLPPALVDAANRVLGQALSVATAPQLPPNVKPITKAFVTRRILDLAEAGQRVAYADPLKRVLPDLLLDWQGAREFNPGFDQIIRETDAGREWRETLAKEMSRADTLNPITRLEDRLPDLAGRGEPWTILALSDETGLLRFGPAPSYDDTNSPAGLWFVEKFATNQLFTWKLSNAVAAAELALALIQTNGTAQLLRCSPTNLPSGACLRLQTTTATLEVDADCDGTNEFELAATATTINELPPTLISARQDHTVLTGRPPKPCPLPLIGNYATVAAALFSKPLRQDLVNVPSAYQLDNGNSAATVQIQPGGRVALLNLRRPVGPILERTLTVTGIADTRGNVLSQSTAIISNSLPLTAGSAVRGRVARGDGSPAIGVPVTLTMYDQNDNGLFGCETFIVRVSQVFTDDDGYFEFDFILAGIPYSISATDITGLSSEALQLILDSAAGDQFNRSKLLELANSSSAQDTLLQAFAVGALPQAIAKAEGLDRALLRDFVDPGSPRAGTIVPVALRFRGRATVQGQVLGTDGATPFSGAAVNLFPDPDSRELGRGVFSDPNGQFAFFGVPLGVFTIEAKTGAGLTRIVAGVLDQPGGATNILIILSTNLVLRTELAGRVTEADNTTAHPGASVFVGKFVDGKFQNIVAAATADAAGYWRAPNIPANIYDVVAISLDGKRKGERRDVAAGAGTTNQVSIALQGLSVVVGKVLSSFGPVSNAIVAGGEALARTDADGNFRLTGVPTGIRTISAGVERTPPGEPPKSRPEFRFPRLGSTTVNVVPGVENFGIITFEPRGSVTGVVRDAGGNPVSGINVALPETGGFSWVPVNSQGEFAFEGLPLGRHTFSAPAPPVSNTDVTGILKTLGNQDSSGDEIQAAIGEAFAIFTGAADPLLNGEGANFNPLNWGFTDVDLIGDGTVLRIDIVFRKQSSIGGKVLNGQGVPIGARVRLTGIGPALNGAPTTVIRGERNSDPALGTFRFDKQALVGDWGLQAASPFFPVVITASGQTATVPPDRIDDTNIVLRFPSTRETNGRLIGAIFNPDGSLAEAGVKVLIRSRDIEVATDTNGTFNISPVTGLPAITPEGHSGVSYFVEASNHLSGAVGAANVIVFPGMTNTVNVRLLGRGALAVTVVQNDGSPAPAAVVDVLQGSYPQTRGELTADSAGRVLFLNLFEGSYSAGAQFNTGPTRLSGRVSARVAPGNTNSVTIRLGPTGTIQGRFVRRDLTTPIAFAQVAIGTLGFATTDTNGFFRVNGVPLGTYRLSSQDPVTGIGATLTTTLTFNGQTNDVILIEQSRGEIHGAIIGSDGVQYVPGVLVTASFSDGITPSRTVTSGPDGRFSFPGSPAGSFQLTAEDPISRLRGHNASTLPDNLARFEINIALQPLASLQIAVLRPDGVTPATNIHVQISGADAPRSADALFENVVHFTGLRLGGYRILAHSLIFSETNSLADSNAVLTTAGQVVSNTVILAGVGAVFGTVFDSDQSTPVPDATVHLVQRTAAGEVRRITNSGPAGEYRFENVAVAPYQLTATLGALAGTAAGTISQDAESDPADIVLAPSGTVIGRLLRANGTTAVIGEDVTLEFPGRPITPFLTRTDQAGRFEFNSVPLGPFILRSFPIGFNGLVRVFSSLDGDGETNNLGDILMDEDVPRVVIVSPPNTATGIPITTAVELTFSEPMDPNVFSPDGIFLQGPSNTIPATLALLGTEGRAVRLQPNASLKSLTTYQVIVIDGERRDVFGQVIGRGPRDLVGRPLVVPFASTFTTADNDPPLLLSIFPTNGQVQVDTRAVMRLTFNEPIRDSNFVLTVTGTNGNITGTASVGLNGLVLAFAPDPILSPNTSYTITASNVFDLAGNRAADEPFVATFATLDTLGPNIALLQIAGGRSPVAGGTVPLEAVLATDEPGASVRFTQNLNPIGSDNSSPFRVNTTLPATGSVTFRAIGTDRFGNDGPFAELILHVLSNEPPSLAFALISPPGGVVTNGQPFSLRVSATDDLDVTNITVIAIGAIPVTTNFTTGAEQILTFVVPSDAAPDQLFRFHARATDALGLPSAETIIELEIADGTPPLAAILSPPGDSLLDPESPLNLVVSSSDNSGAYTLEVILSGGITATQTLEIASAPNTGATNIFVLSLADAQTDGATVFAILRAFDRSNLVALVSRSFRLPDRRAPQLVSVNPANGSTAQSLWLSRISFTFDEPLDPSTANANNISLRDGQTNPLPFALRLENGNQRLVVEFQTPLNPGEMYSILLGPDLADPSSNRWQNIGGIAVPSEGAAFTFATAHILGVFPPNNSQVFAGQTAQVTVHFEAGLGANFFRFLLDSNPPVDIAVSAASSNATANLLIPNNATNAHIVISAHRAGETPFRVTQLDLQVQTAPDHGTVRGLITAPNSQPVSGAQITLIHGNLIRSVSSGSDGRYEFLEVPLGTVRVVASEPVTSLRGFNSGTLNQPGQILTLNIPLSASGTITGAVFHVDNTTPVANATVVLSGQVNRTTTADAQGRYSFDFVPLGTFTLDATDPATGDRGRISSQLNASGETRTVNVVLNGQGRLVVIVRDGSENLVANAEVRVFSQTVFGGIQTATTDINGEAIFERVLAGNVFVTAFDPQSTLSGSVNGFVALDTTTTLTVRLQPAGNITGRVFALDGTNPVAGVTVRLLDQFLNVLRDTTSGADGGFAFERIALGTYVVDALDTSDRLRARESSIPLLSNGVTQVRNLTFVGLGTVTGQVLNPDSTGASDVPVTLRSFHPKIGSLFSTVSGSNGLYTIAGVPVGAFSVVATDSSRQLQGESSGELLQEEQTVVANIQLVDNSISLPLELFDANSMRFDLQENGSIQQGHNATFSAFVNGDIGAMLLDIVQAGSPQRFSGSSVGTFEQNRREIAVRQQALGGLEVTRKVFVPHDSYFARYLEILHNPGAEPITIDLRVRASIRQINGAPRIVATSSGDTLLAASGSNPDRWVVIDDASNTDPFNTFSQQPLVFVFDGVGASNRVGSAVFTVSTHGQLNFAWTNITVPPGGTITFLHFMVQQLSQAAARAAADRLSQLPPEALEGLSPTEIQQVCNFALPANGTSVVPPLPALTGVIAGRLLASDQATPLPFTSVEFQSTNIFFARTHSFNTDESGRFLVRSEFSDFNVKVVPVDEFRLSAFHPVTSVIIEQTNRFPTAPTNVAGNLAVLGGTAQASTFVQFGGEPHQAIDGNLFTMWQVDFFQSPSQGGQPFLDILLPAATVVTQVNLRSQPFDCCFFTSGRIELFDSSSSNLFSQVIDFDAAGNFSLSIPTQPNVRFVRFTGLADNSSFPRIAEFEVIGSANLLNVVQADLVFTNTGIIAGTVRRHTGVPIDTGGSLNVLSNNNNFVASGTLSNNGTYQITGVPAGSYTLRVFVDHPQGTSLAATNGFKVTNGFTTTLDMTLPPTGELTGTVRDAEGNLVSGASLEVQASGFSRFTSSDFEGRYLFTDLPPGNYAFQVTDPRNSTRITSQISIVADQTTTKDIALAGVGTVNLQVNFASGAPASGITVQVRMAGQSFFQSSVFTDGSGQASVANVTIGQFVLRAFHPQNFNLFTDITNNMPTNGAVVSVTITLPGTGIVQGQVTFARGAPAGNVQVRLFVPNVQSFFAQTTANGNYSFTQVPTERPFSVRVSHPNNGNAFAETTNLVLSVDGQTLTNNLRLPALATLRVTVLQADSSPLAGARVFLRDAFVGSLQFKGNADSAGVLNIPNVPEGSFGAQAQHPSSFAFAGSATGAILQTNDLQTVSVTINAPTFGTVQGTIVAADAATPLPSVFVNILDAASGQSISSASTDTNGFYQVSGLTAGSAGVRVDVFSPRDFSVVASGTGTFTNGQPLVLNFVLPLSVVRGTVFQTNGVTPVVFPNVSIFQTNQSGFADEFSSLMSGQDGSYFIVGVSTGAFAVIATDSNSRRGGRAFGTMTNIAAPLRIDVVVGDFVTFDLDLVGSDGFRYDVDCDGAIDEGGTSDNRLPDAYEDAYELDVDNHSFNCERIGRLEANGRQIVLGPQRLGQLDVTRKIFVPAAGGFARLLEILANATTNDVIVPVRVSGEMRSSGRTRIIVHPASNTNTFAVTDGSLTGSPLEPALAHVFAGPNAPLSVSTADFEDGDDDFFYEWNVVVPAGETVILMHFAAQREPADAAGARVIAEALTGLTQPDALAAMTAEELAAVVNFNIAAPTPLQIHAISFQPGSDTVPENLAASDAVTRVAIQWRSAPRQNVVVQSSSDLLHWTDLNASIEETAPGSHRAVVPVDASRARFFRLRLVTDR